MTKVSNDSARRGAIVINGQGKETSLGGNFRQNVSSLCYARQEMVRLQQNSSQSRENTVVTLWFLAELCGKVHWAASISKIPWWIEACEKELTVVMNSSLLHPSQKGIITKPHLSSFVSCWLEVWSFGNWAILFSQSAEQRNLTDEKKSMHIFELNWRALEQSNTDIHILGSAVCLRTYWKSDRIPSNFRPGFWVFFFKPPMKKFLRMMDSNKAEPELRRLGHVSLLYTRPGGGVKTIKQSWNGAGLNKDKNLFLLVDTFL